MKFFICPFETDFDPQQIDWESLPDLELADIEARLRSLGYEYLYPDSVFKPRNESEAMWLFKLAEAQREAAIAEFNLTETEVTAIEQQFRER
ncbi:MAG: hypothetical protein J0L70_23200 [Leptolyngbya sp. UWPOB_LEPTO1]|uniref:hypothetical protein n=1 Tax=Leptolyngbya sp. UWPOB_LEPTO1 TaxID=2815653 RepID=UPI001AC83AFF|nr:hypothetical protein [Leptolyngbya sp. UWPOB_LEPTO1]MBN8563448.1 hypothetical protein [Leptolyngbya sp. UWPOB_LEPTO1]